MEDILRLRHEAARLLEFASYAEYALANRMARTVPEVTDFLRELVRAAKPAGAGGARRAGAVRRPQARAPGTSPIYSERLQQSRYAVSQEELREYLPLPRVLEGLFEVAEKLFDVRIRERDGVPLWHPDARYFEVQSPSGARGRQLLSRCLRAPAQAQRRLDG